MGTSGPGEQNVRHPVGRAFVALGPELTSQAHWAGGGGGHAPFQVQLGSGL